MSEDIGIKSALTIATRITESICQLPAVATLDWADRAGACLTEMASDSIACLLIGSVDSSGQIVGHESTGVAVGALAPEPVDPGARPMARPMSARRDDRAIELTLRSRAERLRKTGLDLASVDRGGMVVGSLARHLRAEDWTQVGLGELWAGMPVRDAVLAVSKLGTVEPGRVLIAMVGVPGGGALDEAQRISVMSVTMPLLVRRALTAIGSRKTTSARWLTHREQQVLEELTLGKSVRQIAEEMGRSPHTIHDHVKSLHRKLNASSRGELVARALGYLDESMRAVQRTAPEPIAAEAEEPPAPEITTVIGSPGRARPIANEGQDQMSQSIGSAERPKAARIESDSLPIDAYRSQSIG